MQSNPTHYDTVLYPSYTHPQTHPDRLEVIGKLFGLNPAPATRSRVLEVGCGDGMNLIPMAWALPESDFAGIDLAARPIERGQQMIRDLDLKNIRLVPDSITAINESWGKFDYVIAHGFYSWVPAEVRERLLAICRHALNPQGIAFISYSAYPGGHLQTMLREMLRFHTRACTDPQEKMNQALALARFLAEAQDTQDEFRLWMRAAVKRISEHVEGHLYHDELAEINDPLYFTQFIERAARHDLQYLGEADYFEMSAHGFKSSVRQTLVQLGSNRILREQYLDFLKCRQFRQTLLCHRECQLQLDPDARHVASFSIASGARRASGPTDLNTPGVCTFETPKGGRCETDYPLGKAALTILGELWPQIIPFPELLAQSLGRLASASAFDVTDPVHQEKLCGFLLQLYSAGIVDFRAHMPAIARTVSERPVASPVARWQARQGRFVTSLFHVAVNIEDEIGRQLFTWLDGTNDRAALLAKLWNFLHAQGTLNSTGQDESALKRKLESDLDNNLVKLAQSGLLIE